MADSANKPRAVPDAETRRKGRLLAGIDNQEAAPVVPSIITNDPDGLLDATKIHDRIEVQIAQWGTNPTQFNETLWLYWRRPGDSETEVELLEVEVPPNSNFPLAVFIDADNYVQGRLELTYSVLNRDLNMLYSAPTTITVDSVPPYGDRSPESPVAPDYGAGKEGVITDAFLDNNNGKAIFTIPKDYPDQAPEDMVFFYWLREVPDPDAIDELPHPTVPPFAFSEGDTVELERTHLEAVGDGICYAVYVLKDKAGNLSRISWWEASTVALGPLPENLVAPSVPQALDGVVNRQDGHEGVQLRISSFDGWKNGDLIHATWGNTPLATYPIGPAPTFPLDIPVPWPAINANYDYQDENAAQQVTVGYQVSRVGLLFPDNPLTAQVNVDLRVVGPDKPDPDPVNGDLPPVVVKGASDLENKLTPDDNGKEATATILLFDNAQENDEVWLYWGGVLNTNIYYVQPTDLPGPTHIEIKIPWPLIERVSNNLALPVYYRITDANQVNYQQSPTTSVDARAVVVTLPPPEFPDIFEAGSGRRVLNCSTIQDKATNPHFRVHVPPSPHIKAGMEVTFSWVVTEQADGTGSIDGTERTEMIVVTPAQATNGIDWTIEPYATKILPAWSETTDNIGFSRLKYSTFVGEVPTESVFVVEQIGLTEGTGSCRLTED